MSYQNDKRELLKLKQGITSEEDSFIHEEEKPVYDLHGIKWLENFWYRNKWYVVMAVFGIVVLTVFTVQLLQRKDGDIRVMVVTKNNDISANVTYKIQDFETAFETYCPDYDDNGYVHAEVYYADLSESSDYEYMSANVTKVTSEILIGEAQLFLVDKEAAESMSDGAADYFVDLSEIYPDVDYIDGAFLQIKGSGFAANAQYFEACPDNLYLVVRNAKETDSNSAKSIPAKKKALEMIDNIVNGYYAGWIDDQGRIYGIKGEETTANEA